ncbi:MAG: hypothetical protein K2J77_07795 [Oscillospiraceae bacterium]|nr:hypothetical protein [Oscillospiraceae bacterium]
MAVVLLMYYLIYFNRCLPLNEGWPFAYAKLMSEGKVPYRDFYYYMPPLDLFESFVFWKLSFGHALIFRAFRMAERIFTFEVLFFELKKHTSSFGAWVGCIVGGVFISATNHDTLGDYNYSSATLLVFTACSMNRFIRAGSKPKKSLWMMISGVLLGLMSALKQPMMVAACVILFLYLIFYCVKEKEPFLKRALQAIGGMLIPLGIICAYLIANNAFVPMLEQVYLDTSYKGTSPLNIIFSPFLVLINEYILLLISIAILLLYVIYKKNLIKKNVVLFRIVSATIPVIAFILYLNLTFMPEFLLCYILYILLIGGVFAALYIMSRALGNADGEGFKSVLPAAAVTVLFAVVEGLLLTLAGGYYVDVYKASTFANWTTSVSFVAFVLGIFAIAYFGFRKKAVVNWGLLSLLVCAFIYEYNLLMTSKVYFPAISVSILLPVLIALLLDYKAKHNSLKQACVITGCFLICIFCMSQKIAHAFSWWGNESDPIYEETCAVDIKGLEGFRLSEEKSNMFKQVYKTVESNTDENSTVLGYPHTTLFNVLLDKDFPGFVPVLFYDVCSDEYALRDLERFKEAPPDIIIYADIPACLEYHEKVFRDNKRSGQRAIMEWLVESEEQYTLICQASNVFVYKLNDNGVDIGYTYFESDDFVNESLEEIKHPPKVDR